MLRREHGNPPSFPGVPPNLRARGHPPWPANLLILASAQTFAGNRRSWETNFCPSFPLRAGPVLRAGSKHPPPPCSCPSILSWQRDVSIGASGRPVTGHEDVSFHRALSRRGCHLQVRLKGFLTLRRWKACVRPLQTEQAVPGCWEHLALP